jgi:hypothetical protein
MTLNTNDFRDSFLGWIDWREFSAETATVCQKVQFFDLRRYPNTDYRQARFGKSTEQPLRQRSSFQSDPLEAV